MASEPYIPAKTLEKLNGSHPEGTRHKAKIDIAIPLIGNGMAPDAVAAQLKAQFPNASEKEINGVVQYAVRINPAPSVPTGNGTPHRPTWTPKKTSEQKPKLSPQAAVKRFLGDASRTVASWEEQSPVPIPSPAEHASALMEALYGSLEHVNIVVAYGLKEDGKCFPKGGGKTLTRTQWQAWNKEKGVPQSKAGAWMRFNPVSEVGSGADGAPTDADVKAYRFMLIEHDSMALPTQLAFIAKLNLPIAALLLSGGDSVHAWVRLDAETREHYDSLVVRILTMLAPFGYDQANKNPSRLSRLVGATREIGASGDGIQRLIYLNPKAKGKDITEDSLARLEKFLQTEALPAMPMKEAGLEALERIGELHANKGKLGLQTGIPNFDQMSGGLKKKKFYVLAAESKAGKSTLALNIANNAALLNQKGVALFSLEMDRDEVTDYLVCMNGSIDRNKFNTGYFEDEDWPKIQTCLPKIQKMPLWIFDSPSLSATDIVERVHRLKQEHDIGLVIVDYIQLVIPEDERQPREQQVTNIVRSMRIMAKECDVPVLALSQLNDEGKLRESRSIGFDAHGIFMLEEKGEVDNYSIPRDIALRVVRARSIPRGKFDVYFEPVFCRMTGDEKTNQFPEIKPPRR